MYALLHYENASFICAIRETDDGSYDYLLWRAEICERVALTFNIHADVLKSVITVIRTVLIEHNLGFHFLKLLIFT
jgi:hypothetical protein